MTKNTGAILKEVLSEIRPGREEMRKIEKILALYLKKINSNIKRWKIPVEVFLGGSFVKNTMIKKDNYDIDIFLRFDKKQKELSEAARKVLTGIDYGVIHGSRDYFQTKAANNLYLEFVPVVKIKKAGEAENVTDLSYSHVNYIKKKIKSEKIFDEIRLAKAFCYANNAYGAESYIRGFSGYAIELLVYHYKSFLNFIKAISKINPEKKTVIDIEKHHRDRASVLRDINAAKLGSPIVLIDPTYKTRNALAALSEETLKKFQKACREFLKKPSVSKFRLKSTDMESMRKSAGKKAYEHVILELKTEKQAGDIAGSKLLKFYKHLDREISRFFEIRTKAFVYGGEKIARAFFAAKKKNEILISGPRVSDEKHVERFKQKHKETFIKNQKLYVKHQPSLTLEKFLRNWKTQHKKKISEMGIDRVKIF